MDIDTLHTARLDLLPLQVTHAAETATTLHTFIGGSPSTPEALRLRYERLVAGCPDPSVSWCNWVLREKSESRLVGTVQATVTGSLAEIAWIIGTPWQGRGYATEAARALVAHLGQVRVSTVIAHIHPDHHASAAVARATGLEPTEEQQDGEVRWLLSLRP
ncbi:GNAT family N-acetyltransferase [Streptomyces sp. AF1B]|jgi:RimJ/RimL family protein N-acetyltransferase|uniref:GNAT family N-acetyltransferase n=1 Tax=Streptomyces sp. AF1B TaxID=3399503 RepID=UPI003AAA350A